MQAIYAISSNSPYSQGMPGGRPPKLKRSPFGERLCAVRQQRGYSQTQLAEMIGVTQQAYAGWERSTVALRPEDIASLAAALQVSADELLGLDAKPKRKGGPVGKAQQVFETVSKLPRHQQQKIVDVVETLIAGQQSR
jgi:transcriptional regulator with XRE-family HTH domain